MNLLRRDRLSAFVLPFLALYLLPVVVMADGGTLRLSERNCNYQIAVFTAPAPLRAGPVDISVLIQNATTQEAVLDADVTIRAMQQGQPGVTICHAATTQAATNKLFHAATFELPTPGEWEMEVYIHGPLGMAKTRFSLEAAEPLPRYLAMWPWICWPVLPILVFGIQQLLVRYKLR